MNKGNSVKLKTQMLSELVTERIIDWIIEGKIAMGEKLNTEDLAERLGVSRMPVREALKDMEKNGLVELIPYVGTRVVELKKEDIEEIYVLRICLEPVAAYYACEKITDNDIKKLEKIQRELKFISKENTLNARKIFTLNSEFHATLYKIADNKRLCNVISMLWDNLAFYKLIYATKYTESIDEAEKMLEEHQQYIELLKNRDSKGIKKSFETSLTNRMLAIPYNAPSILSQ